MEVHQISVTIKLQQQSIGDLIQLRLVSTATGRLCSKVEHSLQFATMGVALFF